jgi:putative lipoprotein
MIAERFPPRPQTHRRVVPGAALVVAVAVLLRPSAAAGRDDWLGRDKALHFGVTFTLAGAGYAAAAPLHRTPVARLGLVATLVMATGIAKEMHDRATGGDPSLRDLAWDGVGTATGLVVGWLVDRYLASRSARR